VKVPSDTEGDGDGGGGGDGSWGSDNGSWAWVANGAGGGGDNGSWAWVANGAGAGSDNGGWGSASWDNDTRPGRAQARQGPGRGAQVQGGECAHAIPNRLILKFLTRETVIGGNARVMADHSFWQAFGDTGWARDLGTSLLRMTCDHLGGAAWKKYEEEDNTASMPGITFHKHSGKEKSKDLWIHCDRCNNTWCFKIGMTVGATPSIKARAAEDVAKLFNWKSEFHDSIRNHYTSMKDLDELRQLGLGGNDDQGVWQCGSPRSSTSATSTELSSLNAASTGTQPSSTGRPWDCHWYGWQRSRDHKDWERTE
jgi:hypothetical protein